jgi:hypothetical protein
VSIVNGKFLSYASCLSAIVLGGCMQSTSSWEESENMTVAITPSSQSSQFVDQELGAQITSLEASLKNFSNFFLFQDDEIKLPQRQLLSSHQLVLNRHVFIDWSGPVEQLLADLSKITGYKSQVIGATPVIPPLITLNHHHIKVLDVIRDAALQIHQKADLVVYPDEQLIELRYR